MEIKSPLFHIVDIASELLKVEMTLYSTLYATRSELFVDLSSTLEPEVLDHPNVLES